MRSHGALFRFLMIVCLLILTTSLSAQQQQVKRPTSHTQIVLLGTGNPPADPDRSGPATAIVVDGTPYLVDFETRSQHYREKLSLASSPEGHKVNAHEITAGVVYKDANVTVTAFPTKHAMESYGYRFDTPDRSIVISGDTNPTQATIDACHGCDVLIHEVLTLEWLAKRPDFQNYASKYHTSTVQLAELATKAKPGLLILYHASLSWRPAVDAVRSTPAELLNEMTSRYSGRVVVGRDLDVY